MPPVAVIDIGSNAVRLVVYDSLCRAPLKIRSERAICNLGAGLHETGCLGPDAVKKALTALRRFSRLIKKMKIRNVHTIATAALRDAKNGNKFIADVKKETGLETRIIGGKEEAKLVAFGIFLGSPEAGGVFGDYGGGSLELIAVEKGRLKHRISLPLGSHRLLAEKTRAAQIKKIDSDLAENPFIKKYAGRDFYATGGAWRAFGEAHMKMSGHPVPLLDHYRIKGSEALKTAHFIAQQSPAFFEKKMGMSEKRASDVGVSALVLERLFKNLRPKNMVFPGATLRDGIIYSLMKPALRRQDPLIVACRKIAQAHHPRLVRGSKSASARLVNHMTAGLPFGCRNKSGMTKKNFLRLLEASCLLSRADHDFLTLPLYGIDHEGRAFLALTQHVRQGRRRTDQGVDAAKKLLNKEMFYLAVKAGLAERELL